MDRYTTTVAEYKVSVSSAASGTGGQIPGPQAQRDGPSVAGLQAAVVLLVVSLLALLAWNFYKGHLPLPWNCRSKKTQLSQESNEQRALAQEKPLGPGTDNGSSHNSHNDTVTLPSLQYIDEESDI